MAIALDAVSEGSANAASLTIEHTTTTDDDRYLLVVIGVQASTDVVTGVTADGITMTRSGGFVGISRTGYFYRLDNPPSGTYDIVVSLSAANEVAAAVLSFTGATTGGSTTQTTGSSAAPFVSRGNVVGEFMIVAVNIVMTASGDPIGTPEPGWTELAQIEQAGNLKLLVSIATTGIENGVGKWTLDNSAAWRIYMLNIIPSRIALISLNADIVFTSSGALVNAARFISTAGEQIAVTATALLGVTVALSQFIVNVPFSTSQTENVEFHETSATRRGRVR